MRREGDHLPRLVALGALEVLEQAESVAARQLDVEQDQRRALAAQRLEQPGAVRQADDADRKSTRLNSSHLVISYAVFCLKKKKKKNLAIALLARQTESTHDY